LAALGLSVDLRPASLYKVTGRTACLNHPSVISAFGAMIEA